MIRIAIPYKRVVTKIPLAVLSRCVFTYIVNKTALAKRHRAPTEVINPLVLKKYSRNSPKVKLRKFEENK